MFLMYKKEHSLNIKIHKSLNRIAQIIDAVRYGDLSVRIENKEPVNYQRMIESINRMIETFADREKMIVEYQKGLKNKNADLEKMIEKEKSSQQAKRDFVATLTHDLKVPIIAESNTLDFLLDGRFGDFSQIQIDVLQKMKSSNKELIELVETLLDTYKSEDNPIQLNKKNINIETLINDVLLEMIPIAESNNQSINLNLNYKNDVCVDEMQIKRVLKNLISNGLSFSSEETSLTIETYSDNNKIFIKVIDTGMGISKDDIEHIFDKFYSTAKKFRKVGTGLGLYLSNQIVKAHKGKITVESKENEYSAFTIELPL